MGVCLAPQRCRSYTVIETPPSAHESSHIVARDSSVQKHAVRTVYAQVMVHSAHAVTDTEGVTTLVPCMRSHVTVLRFSPFAREAAAAAAAAAHPQGITGGTGTTTQQGAATASALRAACERESARTAVAVVTLFDTLQVPSPSPNHNPNPNPNSRMPCALRTGFFSLWLKVPSLSPTPNPNPGPNSCAECFVRCALTQRLKVPSLSPSRAPTPNLNLGPYQTLFDTLQAKLRSGGSGGGATAPAMQRVPAAAASAVATATLARGVAERLGFRGDGARPDLYAEFFDHATACVLERVRYARPFISLCSVCECMCA